MLLSLALAACAPDAADVQSTAPTSTTAVPSASSPSTLPGRTLDLDAPGGRGGAPLGMAFIVPPGSAVQTVAGPLSDGSKGFRFTARAPGDAIVCTEALPLGAAATVAARLKLVEVLPGPQDWMGLNLELRARGPGGVLISPPDSRYVLVQNLRVAGDWTEVEATVPVPHGATAGELCFRFVASTGTVEVDRVRIADPDVDGVPPASVAAPAPPASPPGDPSEAPVAAAAAPPVEAPALPDPGVPTPAAPPTSPPPRASAHATEDPAFGPAWVSLPARPPAGTLPPEARMGAPSGSAPAAAPSAAAPVATPPPAAPAPPAPAAPAPPATSGHWTLDHAGGSGGAPAGFSFFVPAGVTGATLTSGDVGGARGFRFTVTHAGNSLVCSDALALSGPQSFTARLRIAELVADARAWTGFVAELRTFDPAGKLASPAGGQYTTLTTLRTPGDWQDLAVPITLPPGTATGKVCFRFVESTGTVEVDEVGVGPG